MLTARSPCCPTDWTSNVEVTFSTPHWRPSPEAVGRKLSSISWHTGQPGNVVSQLMTSSQGGICRGVGGGHVLITEFRGMPLNGLFCADVLRPLDLAPPLTDFTYKHHPANSSAIKSRKWRHELMRPHRVMWSSYILPALCAGYNYDSTSIRRPFDCLPKVTKVTWHNLSLTRQLQSCLSI